MIKWLTLLGIVLLFYACNETEKSVAETIKANDTLQTIVKDSTLEEFNITYQLLFLNDSIRKNLKNKYSKEELSLISALNRIDVAKIYKVDSIVVPDTFFTDLLRYSPFPDSFPQVKEIKKIILVSYPIQAFAFYFNGKLQRWGPVNMGKKSTPTPTGLLHTNWKSKRQISTENPEWILP